MPLNSRKSKTTDKQFLKFNVVLTDRIAGQKGQKNKDERQRMNRTYKAAQVTQPGKFEVVERTLVERAFGQVRIRVEACGVCHTELQPLLATRKGKSRQEARGTSLH